MIVELDLEALQHGSLASIFFDGACAVLVRCGDAMPRMWKNLMENAGEVLPWESSLTDMARNYHGSGNITTSVGDVFYIQPGAHGYFARKLEISRSGQDGAPCATPASFWQTTGEYRIAHTTLSDCCALADRITAALVPRGRQPPQYRVALHRLKYQRCIGDYQQLAAIAANSLGRWGRLGARVDAYRQALARPLSARGLSDALSWMMIMPALRPIIVSLSRTIARCDPRSNLPDANWLVERPHVDNRFFTGLSGDRQNVRTEVFCKGAWLHLPLSRDTVAIFPGTRSERLWGLRATCHRVVLEQGHDPLPSEARTTNSTILIGAL